MIRRLYKIFTPRSRRTTTTSKDPLALARLDELLRTPGRAHQSELIYLAHTLSKGDFVSVVHCPSLVGSAIRAGELSNSQGRGQDLLTNATFQFSPTTVSSFLEGGSIEQAVFLLRKEPNRADRNPTNRFTIGRAKTNDIRIVDFAISREHAVIEYSSGVFYINDCRSRNGTKVNSRSIYALPERLSDRDVISLGRYEFSFLMPETLYERLLTIKLPTR